VLANTTGKLLTDAYSGYDKATVPGSREQAGCMAHLRRKFFEAIGTTPEAARKGMDLIVDLYRVESIAIGNGVHGTPAHPKLRMDHCEPTTIEMKLWLGQEHANHPQKSPIGEAMRYALSQRDALSLSLTDHRLPIDHNASERPLQVAALGRKNFLFVGHDPAGENLAGLYSLVAACEAKGVNPVAYFADILMRVQTHPASGIDEILPHSWAQPEVKPSA
jgi:transposase